MTRISISGIFVINFLTFNSEQIRSTLFIKKVTTEHLAYLYVFQFEKSNIIRSPALFSQSHRS